MQENRYKLNKNQYMYYIHTKPESFASKFFQFYLWGTKAKYNTAKKIAAETFTTEPVPIPQKYFEIFDIRDIKFKDRNYWIFRPKDNISEKVILYIHGGAYIANIAEPHWDLITSLIDKTNATFVVPNYKTAPFGGYQEMYDFVYSVYAELIEKTSVENLIVMGDSAGGGFSLSLAETLKENNEPGFSQIILLCPWLDISLSNPNIIPLEKNDQMLEITACRDAGKLFAKEISEKDQRVSPIYGNFDGLGKISIFTGTHDLLYADNLKLKEILETKKIDFNFFEFPEMFHVWMAILKLKEAKVAIEQISELINSSN